MKLDQIPMLNWRITPELYSGALLESVLRGVFES